MIPVMGKSTIYFEMANCEKIRFYLSMIIFPAIDLKNGRCVRLLRGEAARETVYHEDPAVPAQQWKDEGADWLHVVDLDGAFSGESSNLKAIERILSIGGMRVQLGGGLRSESSVRAAMDLGVSRVIVGTRACIEPQWTAGLIENFGADRIVAGIDARDGMAATKGWVETTEVPAIELARRLMQYGVTRIIHTDIATDGAMKGPNLAAQAQMAQAIPECKLIASGGVTNQKDLGKLSELAERFPNMEGVIVGKALYENTISLQEVL